MDMSHTINIFIVFITCFPSAHDDIEDDVHLRSFNLPTSTDLSLGSWRWYSFGLWPDRQCHTFPASHFGTAGCFRWECYCKCSSDPQDGMGGVCGYGVQECWCGFARCQRFGLLCWHPGIPIQYPCNVDRGAMWRGGIFYIRFSWTRIQLEASWRTKLIMPILQQSAYERNCHILFSMILVVFDMDVAVFAPPFGPRIPIESLSPWAF